MNKVFILAGAIALSIIPTPTFSGEVEQKEMMSVTEQLLPQIGEKYNNLDIKEKKAYKEALINYLEDVQKTGATGVGEAYVDYFGRIGHHPRLMMCAAYLDYFGRVEYPEVPRCCDVGMEYMCY